MRGDRRVTPAMVAVPCVAVVLVLGVVAAAAVAGGPAPVGRNATVAGNLDARLVEDVTTTTAVPAPTVTTRPSAATSSTVAGNRSGAVPVPTFTVPAAPTTTASVAVATTVPRPADPPNGPARPTVSVRLMAQLPDGTVTVIAGEVQDLDGWIRAVTVDWGDGSPPARFGPPALNAGPCPMAGGLGTAGDPVSLPSDQTFHRYSGPAPRVITVTATSTSCDGVSDPQTGVGRVVLSAPPA